MKTSKKRNVVFTYLSPQFDFGSSEKRWDRLRPTVDLCTQTDIEINILYLRIFEGQESILEQLQSDLATVAPHTKVIATFSVLGEEVQNSSDFEVFYLGLYHYFSKFPFDYENEDYLFFIPPGRGATYSLALVLVITYLNIDAQFLHNKVILNSTNSPTRSYITYKVNLPHWLALIGQAELNQVSALGFLKYNIDTKNEHYNKLMQRLEHVALNSYSPLLVSGESGVGKTFLARRIYELKRKAGQVSGKFVEINCGILRGEGIMSMLFGHTKGAYTGAAGARDGLLKSAHNGVLFLDEVSELPLAEQTMLLKAIEDKIFRPFGGDEEVHSNFQLICGTNKNLQDCVKEGSFRYDLLARIGLWRFHLPPLRERPEDIAPNIEHELRNYVVKTARKTQFSPEALTLYLDFATSKEATWAGNMRSLSSSVERMATFATLGLIGVDIAQDEIDCLRSIQQDKTLQPSTEDFPLVRAALSQERFQHLDLFDKFHLEGTLSVCREARSRSEAGRKLYAHSREQKSRTDDTSRLNSYLKTFGLDWDSLPR